jgi:hypothetical protein
MWGVYWPPRKRPGRPVNPHHVFLRRSVGCQLAGPTDLGCRAASAPPRHALSRCSWRFVAISFRATRDPQARVALLLKDAWCVTASHLPVPQYQLIQRGRQPRESLSSCRPIFTGGESFMPGYGVLTREFVKVHQGCPPQSHSRPAFCAAQHREWLR